MENGIFARYQNKIYDVSNINENSVRLVSNDKIDINNGFKEKIYPSNYQNRNNLPKRYIKEVKSSEIQDIYEIDYKAKYAGHEFNISFNKNNNELTIGTTNAELAKKNGFERTDKYYYEKKVKKEDVEIIEEKKDIHL